MLIHACIRQYEMLTLFGGQNGDGLDGTPAYQVERMWLVFQGKLQAEQQHARDMESKSSV